MFTTSFQDGVLTLEEVSKTFPVMGRRPTGDSQGVDCMYDYGSGVDNDDYNDDGDYHDVDDKEVEEKMWDIFLLLEFLVKVRRTFISR